jgi:DNA-binding CsgD family transcriptional regulator
MAPIGSGSGLLGRKQECQTLDKLLARARTGESTSLVLSGEPGVGKSSLLDFVEERAKDCLVVRVAGVESEMELAFAGLHQFCAPLVDGLEALPEPQAAALGTAFGLRAGTPPDRFLIGLAVLTLLSEQAADRPIVCLVDDVQWLDTASAQCLGFVARRLAADRVAMVFTARPYPGAHTWAGLPQITVGGLDDADAAALLESAVPTPVDGRVRNRILAETRGNPLALLQLAQSLSAAELTFGPGRTEGAGGVTGQMEERFRRQLAELPEETRLLLLVAAAEPLGDRALLWAAAERLDIGPAAALPAETAGLFEDRTTARFRHPLVRSVAYWSADHQDRQRAHGALAAVTDPERDPDRRAWHRAHASGPDEAVAAELERSADRALAQGGMAAAAAFLQRAAELTPDDSTRTERELAAAENALNAGQLSDVVQLLAVLEGRPLGELQRARCELLRAQIAFASNRGGDAVFLLLAAARRLEPLLPEFACDTYKAALQAALFVGRLAGEPGLVEVARAARQAPVAVPSRRVDRLMLGTAVLLEDGLAVAVPQLRRAYQAFLTEEVPAEEALNALSFAVAAAYNVWDMSAWTLMNGRLLELARESGALVTLEMALTADSYARLFKGDLTTAAARLDEAHILSEASGVPVHPYAAMALAAFRGDRDVAATVITPAERDAADRGEGLVVCLGKWAWALVCNGNSRYPEALAHCRELLIGEDGAVAVEPYELANSWALAELVEAAVRCDERAIAAEAADLLADLAALCGTDWALGMAARSRALLSEGEEAEELYAEAAERLARDGVRVDHARALLLYGEWLRRSGRRTDARTVLRQAHESFEAMGVRAFAERARRELSATGETVRKEVRETRQELTVQELHIARLAAAGRSNPEIGAELYLSRHTVEWHLKKVFAKLGVTSRHQLRDALAAPVG